MAGMLSKLFRRQPVAESPCPRCGVLTPVDADDCTACGWDLRESYHGPVGAHVMAGPDTRSGDSDRRRSGRSAVV